MRIIKQSFAVLGSIGTLATLHTYYLFLNNNYFSNSTENNQTKVIESDNHFIKNSTINDWKEEAVKNKITGYSGRTIEYQSKINESLNELNRNKEILENSHLYNPDDVTNAHSYINHYNETIKKIEKNFLEDSKKTLEEISQIFSDKGNKFMNDGNHFIKEFLEKWNDFLNTLNIDQLCSLSNLLLGIMILIFLLNIIFIYYGDIFIKYISLEKKYPRLAKIINLRRKFLNFYMSLYFLLIIISLILLFWVNISYLLWR